MNKNKERIKSERKNSLCLMALSTMIPIIIMLAAYYRIGIFPGGRYTVLTSDMGAQYMPLWASLRYVVGKDNSLFFSMSGALGNNFWGAAYYGIFSPLTWFIALVNLEYLPDAIYALTLVRIGLCGLAFSYYLIYSYRKYRFRIPIILISCCYALMSYNVGYSINLMWLDAVIMLPCVLTGVERIINENKPITFIISVFAGLIFNYYISFMAAFFVFLYVLVRLKENGRLYFKQILSFIGYALLGIGMSAVIWIPGVLALVGGKFEEEAKPISHFFRYKLFDVLGQLLSGRYDTLLDNGLPLIFCGTGTIVFALIYLVRGKERIINRVFWLLILSFFLLSMLFVPLDRALHGFMETTCFECRYSFLFSCTLLILSYRGIALVYPMLERMSIHIFLKVIFFVVVITELYINCSIIVTGIKEELSYCPRADYLEAFELKSGLIHRLEDEDDEFYRVSDYSPYTYNDGAWLGYNGIGYFSSCYNLSTMQFMGKIGENQSFHILKDTQRTPIEESLLGVKYRIAINEWSEEGRLIDKNRMYSVYENESSLSLGYLVNKQDKLAQSNLTKNAFENQNQIIKELSGVNEDIFVELEKKNFTITEKNDSYLKNVEFTVNTVCDAPLWMYFEPKEGYGNIKNKVTRLMINNVDMGIFVDPKIESTFMIYLGKYSEGERIDIRALGNIDFGEPHIDYFDESVYHRVIEDLGENQLELIKHSAGHFVGTIDASDEADMLLSLPYMRGWKIKVDNKRVDYDAYKNALIVVPITCGKHIIDIKFIPQGFYCGLIISSISILLAGRLISFCKHSSKSNWKTNATVVD